VCICQTIWGLKKGFPGTEKRQTSGLLISKYSAEYFTEESPIIREAERRKMTVALIGEGRSTHEKKRRKDGKKKEKNEKGSGTQTPQMIRSAWGRKTS